MQMHMLVVISKLMQEKQPIYVALHPILQHEKPNRHIYHLHNNSHTTTRRSQGSQIIDNIRSSNDKGVRLSIMSGITMTMRFHDMRSLTYASLLATITQQQATTSTRSQGCKIIDNFRNNNNDSEIIVGDTKTNITTQSRLKTNKGGEIERPQREEREKENCDGHCWNVLLSHLGKDGQISPCSLTRIVNFQVLGYY